MIKTENNKTIKYLRGDEMPFKHAEFNLQNKNTKCLFLGSRATDKSIKAGYFYLGLKEHENAFWPIISYCFNDIDFLSGDPIIIQTALRRHNIVVSDLIYNCKYLGSKDSETIKNSEEPNELDLINLIKQADIVFLNGGYSTKGTGPLNYLHKFLKKYIDSKSCKNKNHVYESGNIIIDGKITPYLSLESTSSVNRKNIKEKQKSWEEHISPFIKKK